MSCVLYKIVSNKHWITSHILTIDENSSDDDDDSSSDKHVTEFTNAPNTDTSESDWKLYHCYLYTI